MKLNDYIKNLQELQAEGYGQNDIIYAIDDEGNSFKDVAYAPCVGVWNGRDFEAKDGGDYVCIN